jgi:hypothetical protein
MQRIDGGGDGCVDLGPLPLLLLPLMLLLLLG